MLPQDGKIFSFTNQGEMDTWEYHAEGPVDRLNCQSPGHTA